MVNSVEEAVVEQVEQLLETTEAQDRILLSDIQVQYNHTLLIGPIAMNFSLKPTIIFPPNSPSFIKLVLEKSQ